MTKRLVSVTLALIMLLGLFTATAASAAEVRILSTRNLKVGQMATVKFRDSSGTPVSVHWESDNPSVLTTTASGTVQGIKSGTAIVSAMWNGSPYGIKINVSSTSVSISKKSATLKVGQKLTLTLKNANASKVKWSTSNRKIATVSSKGVVKAKKAGKATITAKYGSKKFTCKVTVKNSSMTVKQAFNKVKNYLTQKGKYSDYGGNNRYAVTTSISGFSYTLAYYTKSNMIAFYSEYDTTGVSLFVYNGAKARSAFYRYGDNSDYEYLYYSANFTKSAYKSKSTRLKYEHALGKKQNSEQINNEANSMLSRVVADFNSICYNNSKVNLKNLGFKNWDK